MIGVIQGNPLQQLSRNPLMSMRGEGSEGGVSSSSPPPLTSGDPGASSTPPPNSTRMSRTSDCTDENVAVKTENGPEDPEIKVDDDADDIKEEIDIKPGMKPGTQLRFVGEGHKPANKKAGDLVVHVN